MSLLEWKVFHCHLVMSSGFSETWTEMRLLRLCLPMPLLAVRPLPRGGGPRWWGPRAATRDGRVRDFSCLYFPCPSRFSTNRRLCIAYHRPIPFLFCFVILNGCFQFVLIPHFPYLISGGFKPACLLPQLSCFWTTPELFKAVPNLSFSAGSSLNLAYLKEQACMLLILAFCSVYTEPI